MKRYGKHTPQRAGTGVRGSVEYRKVSEQYVGQRSYPPALFAVVNVLLVLFAAFVVLASAWAFTPLGEALSLGKEEHALSLQLVFYDTSGALSAPALAGTAVFDAASNEVMGEIAEISARQLEKEVVLWQEEWDSLPQNAPTESISYPVQLVTVTVHLVAEYRAADGYYTSWGERLYVGGSYAVSLGGSLATGSCVALSPLS